MNNNKMINNKLESINHAEIERKLNMASVEKIIKICVYIGSILPDIINKIKEILEEK